MNPNRILDDIRRDMEAGKPGPWRAEQPHFANGWWVVFTDPDTDGTVDESGDGGFEEITARRIARVPQLEAIALAAGELAYAVECLLDQDPAGQKTPLVFVTHCLNDLAALRKAMEAAE